MRTKEQMYEDIRNWEIDAGEGFLDYFGSNMNEFNFMFWCLGKGYINESQLQAFESNNIFSGTEYLIGDEEYSVIKENEYSDLEESYEKGYQILADFLTTTTTYQKRVDMFLANITPLSFVDALKEFYKNRNAGIFFEIDKKRIYLEVDTLLTTEMISNAKWYRDDNHQ